MPEQFKPQPKEVIQDWIQRIIDEAQDKLSIWEMKFISDMELAIIKWGALTENQQNKLEQIYNDRTKL